jgi:hypothetical protein
MSAPRTTGPQRGRRPDHGTRHGRGVDQQDVDPANLGNELVDRSGVLAQGRVRGVDVASCLDRLGLLPEGPHGTGAGAVRERDRRGGRVGELQLTAGEGETVPLGVSAKTIGEQRCRDEAVADEQDAQLVCGLHDQPPRATAGGRRIRSGTARVRRRR